MQLLIVLESELVNMLKNVVRLDLSVNRFLVCKSLQAIHFVLVTPAEPYYGLYSTDVENFISLNHTFLFKIPSGHFF